ncbi:MAG: hypothetical protein LBO09_07545 [Candidatus Peribacteria bacterium]|nr:hypothetical protein [Candidatus Peribacteria bacterium]
MEVEVQLPKTIVLTETSQQAIMMALVGHQMNKKQQLETMQKIQHQMIR